MNKTVGCLILSAALVTGLAMPAQALGLPGADPAEGTQGGTVQVLANAAAPAAAAKLRPALRVGSRSPAVMYVQTKLGVKPASGYYGPLTATAVRAVQKRHGLKATGKVSTSTWKVLLRSASASAPTVDPAPATEPATPPAGTAPTPEQAARKEPSLGPGSRGPAVVFVQEKLGITPATGYYGSRTRAAVTTLQDLNDLRTTGEVGPGTWKLLFAAEGVIELPLDARQAAPAAPTPAVPSAPAPPAPAPPALTPAPPAQPTIPATPAPRTIPTPTYVLPENPTAADLAVVFALAQVGKPYVLGGNGPEVFDCSGLIQQAYLASGVKLPRLASQQRFAGTRVELDAIAPGALLYYQDGSSPRKGHISMYVGGGLVVEAANPRRGVRIRTLHEAWYRDRFVAAVRIG